MSKTHRGRAHQQRSESAHSTAMDKAPSSSASARSAIETLTGDLLGLLSIRIQEPFLDLTTLCPRDAYLVLHLDLLHFVPQKRETHTRVQRALDAVATLCVASERLRLIEADHDSFWRRVLASNMMRESCHPQQRDVEMFIKFTRCHGIHVLFSWSDRAFQPAVLPLLAEMLQAPVTKYEEVARNVCTELPRRWETGAIYLPVAFSLRLTNCRLTKQHIAALSSLEVKAPPDAVFDPRAIHSLELEGHTLGSGDLDALTKVMKVSSRRVDALSLARALPSDLSMVTSCKYAASFKGLLKSLFTAKTQDGAEGPGVALDLSRNKIVSSVHLRSLYKALLATTRSLRALDLSQLVIESPTSTPTEATKQSDSIQKWFTRVCFAGPPHAYTTDCTLDVSRTPNLVDTASLRAHLAELVSENQHRIVDALESKETVICRLKGDERYREPAPETRWWGSSDDIVCRITEMRDDGWYKVEEHYLVDPDDEYPTTDSEDEEDDEDDDDGDDEDEDEDAEDDAGSDSGEEEQEPEAETDENDRIWWVKPTSINWLRTGSYSVVGMRFKSLIWDADPCAVGRYPVPDLKSDVFEFLRFVGRDLRHLSLRHWVRTQDSRWSRSTFLRHFARLSQLNVASRHPTHLQPPPADVILDYPRKYFIQVLDISGTGPVTEFLTTLHERRTSRLALKSLSLNRCKLCPDDLRLLGDFARQNTSLGSLDLDYDRGSRELKLSISREYPKRNASGRDEILAARFGLLSVLSLKCRVRVDREIASVIFDFVALGPHLRTHWYTPTCK